MSSIVEAKKAKAELDAHIAEQIRQQAVTAAAHAAEAAAHAAEIETLQKRATEMEESINKKKKEQEIVKRKLKKLKKLVVKSTVEFKSKLSKQALGQVRAFYTRHGISSDCIKQEDHTEFVYCSLKTKHGVKALGVAFIDLQPPDNTYWIKYLLVDDEVRRTGIATRMLHEIVGKYPDKHFGITTKIVTDNGGEDLNLFLPTVSFIRQEDGLHWLRKASDADDTGAPASEGNEARLIVSQGSPECEQTPKEAKQEDKSTKKASKKASKKSTKLQHTDWWRDAELIEDVVDWREHLRERGYAVVTDVLNPAECQAMKNGLFAHAEKIIPGFKSNDKDTWNNDSLKQVFPKHGMLMQHFRWGNTQAVYDVRQNPKVAKAFEKIWEDEALTSSVDGVAFGLPPENTDVGWEERQSGWLHCDQSFQRSEFECVQGWVTANNVERGDATLRVLRDSHKYHGEFAKKFNITEKKDWFKLADAHIEWYVREKGCKWVDVVCPAGSQVLWDSRTIHSGRCPDKERKTPSVRMVVYTCYLPANTMTEKAVEKKRTAVAQGRMTSHWPNKVKLFSKMPQTYGSPVIQEPEYVAPVLTRRGASLFGWHENVDDCPFLKQEDKSTKSSSSSTSSSTSSSSTTLPPWQTPWPDWPKMGQAQCQHGADSQCPNEANFYTQNEKQLVVCNKHFKFKKNTHYKKIYQLEKDARFNPDAGQEFNHLMMARELRDWFPGRMPPFDVHVTTKEDGHRVYWDGENLYSFGRGRKSAQEQLKNIHPAWREQMPKYSFEAEIVNPRNPVRQSAAVPTSPDELQKSLADSEWANRQLVVFDAPKITGNYSERYEFLKNQKLPSFMRLVESHGRVQSLDELEKILASVVERSGEGVMCNRVGAAYTWSRSSSHRTLNILKFKPSIEMECLVVPMPSEKAVYCMDGWGNVFNLTAKTTQDNNKTALTTGMLIVVRHQGMIAGSKFDKKQYNTQEIITAQYKIKYDNASPRCVCTDRTWEDTLARYRGLCAPHRMRHPMYTVAWQKAEGCLENKK